MSEQHLVWIDDERCIGCGACLEVCPTAAISLVGDKARVNEELCTGCQACVDVCPQGAIEPVVEGEVVPLPRHPVPAVQSQRAPLATERVPIVAIGAQLLTVAVEALARAVGQHLAQPSSKARAVSDESQQESGSTRGGGGHRARRRRRGSG
jgi:Fe-S-cluster-containing hydrogenase component 2